MRYFQNIIWKKEIGRRFACLYLIWAEYEARMTGAVKAIEILNIGLDAKAEPRHLLISAINNLQQHLQQQRQQQPAMTIDDEIAFKVGNHLQIVYELNMT